MAWHIRCSTLAALGSLPLAFVLACAKDECCDGADFGGGSTTSVTDGTSGTTVATSTTTPTSSDSGSGSSSTVATEAGTEATSTAADSTTGEPGACTEELTCNPGEICVLPCCGGPKPGCSELRPGGECVDGTLDEGGVRCCQNAPDPKACMQMDWCIPNPCMADPPYCATADEIICNGTDCSTKGCYGDLSDGQLQCSCK
jgi:hypothetical protein